MWLKFALVPLAEAAIASATFFAPGGFGEGHGDFDPAIGLLGLPVLLFVDVVPIPALLKRHDLLFVIWWPAAWNTLLWSLGVAVQKFRERGTKRSTSSARR
jgi:hypothetical protein